MNTEILTTAMHIGKIVITSPAVQGIVSSLITTLLRLVNALFWSSRKYYQWGSSTIMGKSIGKWNFKTKILYTPNTGNDTEYDTRRSKNLFYFMSICYDEHPTLFQREAYFLSTSGKELFQIIRKDNSYNADEEYALLCLKEMREQNPSFYVGAYSTLDTESNIDLLDNI